MNINETNNELELLELQQINRLFDLTRGIKKIPIDYQDHSESAVRINGSYKCGECERLYKREPRVEALMRCGRCSYGYECSYGHKI